MDQFRAAYTKMDELKVERDFMYMMLSGKKEKERTSHLKDMAKVLKLTFNDTQVERGLSESEKHIIDDIVANGSPDLQDSLWFLSMSVMDSITDWMKYGDRANGTGPPPIGNRDMLDHFLHNGTFKMIRSNLLDNRLDVSGFAIAMRSEYAMTVGFTDVQQNVNINFRG